MFLLNNKCVSTSGKYPQHSNITKTYFKLKTECEGSFMIHIVHLNYRAGSTFPVPVCTLPSSMDRTSRCNKVDAVKLYASYRLNLLLLKGHCRRGAWI